MTVVSYFIEALTQYPFTPENEAIMKALSDLYALHGIVENAAEFMNVSVCVCVHAFMHACPCCGMAYTQTSDNVYVCTMYVVYMGV